MKRYFALIFAVFFIPINCFAQDASLGKLSSIKDGIIYNIYQIDSSYYGCWKDGTIDVLNPRASYPEMLYMDMYTLVLENYNTYVIFVYNNNKDVERIYFDFNVVDGNKMFDVCYGLCASLYDFSNNVEKENLLNAISGILIQAEDGNDGFYSKDGYEFYASQSPTIEGVKSIQLMVYVV